MNPRVVYTASDVGRPRLAEEEILVEVRDIIDYCRPYPPSGEEIAQSILDRTGCMPAVWQVEGVLEILGGDT